MPSKFGGIEVQEPSSEGSKFGGVAVDDAPLEAVDMSEKNYGTPKPEGDGFLAHASKTIRDLPDAFTSGRIVSAPLKSMADSMGEFIASPSLHNSIRAIPGVGMMEDAIAAPYRTGASGDTAGAWGDAVDLAGQAALGLRGRVAEPLRRVGGAPADAAPPLIPQFMIDATHAIPIKGAPIRMGMRLINGGARMLGDRPNPGRVYDTSLKPGFGTGIDADRAPMWDGGKITVPGQAARDSVSVPSARAPRIVEPGSRIGQNEFARPLDPVESLPSGRVPGGIHNVTEPAARPSREPALWQQYGAEPISTEPVEFKPIQGELPSGRYPVSSRFPEAPVPPRPARVPGWMDRGVSVSQDEPVRFSSISGDLPSGRSTIPVRREQPVQVPRIAGWQGAGVSPSLDQPIDFHPISGALPSGRTPGAFDVPHQAQILPQEIRPVPLSESPDMQDILRQSIEAIKARKNGSAPPSDEPSAFPLNVRRRK